MRKWRRLERRIARLKRDYNQGFRTLPEYWAAVQFLVHNVVWLVWRRPIIIINLGYLEWCKFFALKVGYHKTFFFCIIAMQIPCVYNNILN